MKENNASSPRKVFYLITPMLSALFSLLVIELLLAVFHPVPYSIEKNMFFTPDPYLGYRLKPNGIGYFNNFIPANANIHGHRDDAISLIKDDNTYRILVLGDSFTVGADVEQTDTYPQVLEKLLNKNFTIKIEVVNAGVGGWEPYQYAQYYEYYGRKFDPDLILVGFFVGNDTYNQHLKVNDLKTSVMGRRVTREDASSPLIKLKIFIYEKLNIARFLMNKGPVMKDFTRKDCKDITDTYIHIQKFRLPNHLKKDEDQHELVKNSIYQLLRIKKAVDQESKRLIVILIPDENQINQHLQSLIMKDEDSSRFDFTMPQSMLIEIFREENVQIIDLLPFFKKDPRCLYTNSTHWTEEGHELAAQIIYDELLSLLPIH